jgi:hypothetical protein
VKRSIKITCGLLAILLIAYYIGRHGGHHSAIVQRMKLDFEQHKALVLLDQSFLSTIATHPNTMTSGVYMLETRFAGKTSEETAVEVQIDNGQLVKLAKQPIQEIAQKGSVVSWERYDMDEGPAARFIGLIDGNMMWGRIYLMPGSGWREGQPSAYGVWRLHPKPDKEQPTGLATTFKESTP